MAAVVGRSASAPATARSAPSLIRLLRVDELVERGRELADLERDGAANAQAAEEEALSGETPVG